MKLIFKGVARFALATRVSAFIVTAAILTAPAVVIADNTIQPGGSNTIPDAPTSNYNTLSGFQNTIDGNSDENAVSGRQNTVSNGSSANIVGGRANNLNNSDYNNVSGRNNRVTGDYNLV